MPGRSGDFYHDHHPSTKHCSIVNLVFVFTSLLSFFLENEFLKLLVAELEPVDLLKMFDIPRGSWNSPDRMFPRIEVPYDEEPDSL